LHSKALKQTAAAAAAEDDDDDDDDDDQYQTYNTPQAPPLACS
jgi:hypothetical protein